ncbi:MAG TPA: hypothetical protein VJ739_19590, partial [Gemmataceae bacterium]|nr:hypothetical protein [Gemmataceae bacterium]
MRSIRLSLVLYLLVLLAAALGAVSALAFHNAHQTLLEKKKAAQKLVEEQYKERQREKRAELDQALLGQATRLHDLIQFQNPLKEFHNRCLLGSLAAASSPNGPLLAPAWLTRSRRPAAGPHALLQALFDGRVKFDASSLRPDDVGRIAEFFQLDTAWGSTYRSASLGEQSLPFDPDLFADEQTTVAWKFDELPLRSGVTVRRIQFKAPPARFVPFFGPRRTGR